MHYIKQITLCIIALLLTGKCRAQNPFTEKTFGTIYNETCFSLIHTSDNGYAFTGATSSPAAGGLLDIYFAKLDSNENLQWTKTYGGAGYENGTCIRQTLDGGYIICGEQTSFGAGGQDGFIMRTDPQGTILWCRAYGLPLSDAFGKVVLTSDSNYIVVGTTSSTGTLFGDIMVTKFNDSGDTLWTRIIGGAYYDAGINLAATNDGGCTICGRVSSFGAGLRDVMLSRIDGNGNLMWFKTYGGLYVEEGMAVTHTSDNGYVITGGTETFAPPGGLFDVYMIKTDSAGNLLWSKTYGGDKIEATYAVVESPDGGYVVTGFTDSWAYMHLRANDPLSILGDDSSHVFFMKVNSLGDTVWTRAFGGTTVDEAYGLINAPDGGYVIGAYSNSFSPNDSLDVYIIHTDSLGVSGCHTYFVSPHIGNPNTIVGTYIPPVSTGLTITNAPFIVDTIAFQSNDPCFGVFTEENSTIKTAGKIFPNPFSVSATIVLPESYHAPLTLTIYDVLGKTVRKEIIPEAMTEVKVERKGLNDGIYFVEINAEGKTIFNAKVIVSESF
jgi:type IX secretion system substrate protein